jgi:putative restriction endonuclease
MQILNQPTSTMSRRSIYPFALASELQDAANEHGYRIAQGQAAGWLFFSSTSAPGEIAVAATESDMSGLFFLSVAHPGAARELKAAPAQPCAKGHAGAFVFPDRDSLFEAVRSVYRLSMSLPDLPYEDFVKETAHLGDTEAEREQKVRIGQNRFRSALMDYWNAACPLTGIKEPELLRASHIIPWAICVSDQERLNVHNGLLLSVLWDAAFDCGLVTFDDLGRPVVSPMLGEDARNAMNLEGVPALSLSDQHRERLKWHRENIWVAFET